MNKLCVISALLLLALSFACDDAAESVLGPIDVKGTWLGDDGTFFYNLSVYGDDISLTSVQKEAENTTIRWGTVLSYRNISDTCMVQWNSLITQGMAEPMNYQKIGWELDESGNSGSISFYAPADTIEDAEAETSNTSVDYIRKL